MMQQLANFIVDHDPMMVLRRTHDTVRYIRWAWNKDHAHPIDEEELRLFLCDEHYPWRFLFGKKLRYSNQTM